MSSRARTYLVATDFSPRSDRALRRAAILAKQQSARIVLVHVVDDDQPERIRVAEQREAAALLDEMAETLRRHDAVQCTAKVVTGDAFEVILAAAADDAADLIVVGPHRRRILRDVFVGTTVERVIRKTRVPVLMANGTPAGPWRRILLALDMSASSKVAIGAVQALGFAGHAPTSALHIHDAPAKHMMRRASVGENDVRHYLTEERRRAGLKLDAFLDKAGFVPHEIVLRENQGLLPSEILRCADELDADLIVVGTRGRSGVAGMVLGSVAREVLSLSDRDVLAVPPPEPE